MKTCCTCRISKDLDQFHKCKSLPDGLYKVCKPCRVISSREYKERHGDKIRADWREWYKKDPTNHILNARAYYRANKASRLDYAKKYMKDNPEKARAHCAKRWATMMEATPKCLTKEQRREMQWFYDTCNELQWLSEEKLHVDHIHPLRGPNFRGLHVPWNLQIIPASKNIAKSNRLEP